MSLILRRRWHEVPVEGKKPILTAAAYPTRTNKLLKQSSSVNSRFAPADSSAYARRAPFVVQCRWHFRHFPRFAGELPEEKASRGTPHLSNKTIPSKARKRRERILIVFINNKFIVLIVRFYLYGSAAEVFVNTVGDRNHRSAFSRSPQCVKHAHLGFRVEIGGYFV